MELRHLRYLVAIAEEPSLVAAAARLQLAQPALSRQLRDLETRLGVELVARAARGSRLTAAGEAAVGMARPILASVREAIERARQSERGLVGRCVLAAGRFALASGLAVRLIERVRAEYPGIEIVIDDRQLHAQWEALERGEVDVGIGTAPSMELPALSVETIAVDAMDSIVVGATHPLAGREEIALEDLRTETFVCISREVESEAIRMLRAEMDQRGFAPAAERIVVGGDEILVHVAAGAGFAMIPASMRAAPPRNLVGLRVTDLTVPIRYVHIHRRDDERPVVGSIVGALRRASAEAGFDSGKGSAAAASDPPAVRAGFAPRLELRHLRYFAAILEEGTIGRAAERLGLTQPALSRAMRDLEEEVGVPLLTRTARGVAPTVAGESLRSDARRILADAERIASEARRALRSAEGRIVVGITASTVAAGLATRAIAACADAHPGMEVILDDVPTPRQDAAILEGRIDLAIGHRYPSLPMLDQRIVRELLVDDVADVALLHAAHPLASRSEISIRELGDHPFLFMKREFCESLYDHVLCTMARAGFTPRIEGTYDSLTVAWALAAQGFGWVFGSRAQAEAPPPGTVAVRMTDFRIPWGLELCSRRDHARTAPRALIAALRDAAARHRDGLVTSGMTSQ